MFEYMVYVTVLAHAIPVLMNPCKKLTKIWELLVCTFSFLFYMPTYIHMFIIFSFCRIDDLSWGTKGSDSAANSGSSVNILIIIIIIIIMVILYYKQFCFYRMIREDRRRFLKKKNRKWK